MRGSGEAPADTAKRSDHSPAHNIDDAARYEPPTPGRAGSAPHRLMTRRAQGNDEQQARAALLRLGGEGRRYFVGQLPQSLNAPSMLVGHSHDAGMEQRGCITDSQSREDSRDP
jgi:hypothetical protein